MPIITTVFELVSDAVKIVENVKSEEIEKEKTQEQA